MLTAIIFLTSLAQILVCLFVLSRGRRNLSNLLFFFIGLASLGWALTNYLVLSFLDSASLIYMVRLILFFVVIQNSFFYLFARTFPGKKWAHSYKRLAIYGVFSLLAATITLSPFVFTSVEIKNGVPVTQAGPGILIFVAHATFSIAVAFKVLISKLRKEKGVRKLQLRILLLASFLIWVVVPITNFALTPMLQTTFFIKVAPIYTLAFASVIAYAIVASKLFDIKLIAARSVVYILSLGVIGLVYASVLYAFTGIFEGFAINENTQDGIFIGFALVTALSLQPVKHFFDKISNKLFFRDAYEPQIFLDQLNNTIVKDIDIHHLLKHAAAIIENNLKAECYIYITKGSKQTAQLVGTNSKTINENDAEVVAELLMDTGNRLILIDELNEHQNRIKKVFDANGIALAVSLMTGHDYEHQARAYLFLGPKKSGDTYSSQDMRIIDIIADELIIAIENTLRFEEIHRFNETLQQEIDDATSKLRHTNAKLKALDETKDEFISMASHQLRTPLTSVKGYLSMVLEGDAGGLNEQQRKLLTQAFTSSQRMNYLISDLLNVSRLRTGKFVIEPTPTYLPEIVEGELDQLRETARIKGVELTFEKPKDFPILALDETKIRQVIMNFMDNAVHYTPEGGKIRVELEARPQAVEYRVIDNGLGVPKADQHKLFDKFFRADNARRARPDGTGLGLFMAKKVIVAQGGAVIFKSTEGKGSTFGFTFPRHKLEIKNT